MNLILPSVDSTVLKLCANCHANPLPKYAQSSECLSNTTNEDNLILFVWVCPESWVCPDQRKREKWQASLRFSVSSCLAHAVPSLVGCPHSWVVTRRASTAERDSILLRPACPGLVTSLVFSGPDTVSEGGRGNKICYHSKRGKSNSPNTKLKNPSRVGGGGERARGYVHSLSRLGILVWIFIGKRRESVKFWQMLMYSEVIYAPAFFTE